MDYAVKKDQDREERLFVALELPDQVRDRLRLMPKDTPGLRWIPAENLHLTIHFLGATPPERTSVIRERLAEIRLAAFTIRLDGLGLFVRKHQNILWAGLAASAELTRLNRLVDEAVNFDRSAPSRREKFSPHITLGRAKTGPGQALRNFITEFSPTVRGEFTAAAFTLYQSLLSPAGAVYRAVEKYDLFQDNQSP